VERRAWPLGGGDEVVVRHHQAVLHCDHGGQTVDNLPNTNPLQFDRHERLYWLIFGAIFSVMSFGLIIIAFISGDGSCDRWTVLRYVLPIFPAIAAGSFAGAMSANGGLNSQKVAATGGFAVWLISLLAIGVPSRCSEASINHFRLFENSDTIGNPGNQLPRSLKLKGGTYDVSNATKFVFFFGVVISNIYMAAGRVIDLQVKVAGLADDGHEAWNNLVHYDSLDSWRNTDLAKKFPTDIEQFEVGDAPHDNEFILALAVECMTPAQLADWNGAVLIEVTDHHRQPVRAERFLSLAPKPPQSASIEPASTCQHG
jgi:hypothetical protein